MTPSFWKNKRVFLTGHTGFKGSWLSLWLHAYGAKVIGYALPPNTQPSLFELAKVDTKIASHMGDIRDGEALKSAVIHAKPDIIFHLAAQPLIRYSYQHPVETYQTNVLGTVNILESLRFSDTAKILVNVTTDKCYENKEWNWGYREIDPIGGYDPYSSSKGCAELVTAAYRTSYFNPKTWADHGKAVASARAGNVIGGGDWSEDRLIPDIVKALAQGKKPLIRFPAAIRPWQHVLESLSGYLVLAEKLWQAPLAYAEGWNFGPEDHVCRPVAWIVDHLCQRWGDGAGWEQSNEQHPHEATYLKLDISKAKARLQWYPHWTIDQALDATVFWYKQWLKGIDAYTLTMQQIESFNLLGVGEVEAP